MASFFGPNFSAAFGVAVSSATSQIFYQSPPTSQTSVMIVALTCNGTQTITGITGMTNVTGFVRLGTATQAGVTTDVWMGYCTGQVSGYPNVAFSAAATGTVNVFYLGYRVLTAAPVVSSNVATGISTTPAVTGLALGINNDAVVELAGFAGNVTPSAASDSNPSPYIMAKVGDYPNAGASISSAARVSSGGSDEPTSPVSRTYTIANGAWAVVLAKITPNAADIPSTAALTALLYKYRATAALDQGATA